MSTTIRLLQQFLGLLDGPSLEEAAKADVLLIAVDFENGTGLGSSDSPDLRSHLGVAILDTRDLRPAQDRPPEALISTHQFVTGSNQYCNSASHKFFFGWGTKIARFNILSKLESLFIRTRKIALVGHGFEHDRHVLQRLGFDVNTSIIATFDTRKVASEVLSSSPDGSLRGAHEALQCPFDRLHTASNDANFTLRCLLLLAERSCPTMIDPERAVLLHSIAHSLIPDKAVPLTKSEKNRENKLKRLHKTRRYQSRTWDQETIDQIRAARAIKKQALDAPGSGSSIVPSAERTS